MQLTAKYIDMESAEFTAVLHTEDAREIGVREQDRVRIKHERSSAVTVVQTTDTVVKKGDVGILGKAWSALGPRLTQDPDVPLLHHSIGGLYDSHRGAALVLDAHPVLFPYPDFSGVLRM